MKTILFVSTQVATEIPDGWIPTGPNFGPLNGFMIIGAWLLGILLAIGTVVAIGAFFYNLMLFFVHLMTRIQEALKQAFFRMLMSLGGVVVCGGIAVFLINAALTIGTSVPSAGGVPA